MDPRAALPILLCAAALWSAWRHWEDRPYHPYDGQTAPADPRQTDPDTTASLRHGRWTLTPRARYDITARILGRERYSFDTLADLIPEDLALGWGPMSDSRVLAEFDISQSVRFYSWRPLHAALPVPRDEVITHSANTHVIPLDSRIRTRLESLRVGQTVRLTGVLVDGVRDDGAAIRTSLVRTDSGAGACEIMLVEAVSVP